MAQDSNFFGFGGRPGDEKEVRGKILAHGQEGGAAHPVHGGCGGGYYCALDRNTPLRAKGILIAALGYFILPTDAIPDFIFGLGFTDDIAVLTAAITAVRAHITPAHRLAAREAIADKG